MGRIDQWYDTPSPAIAGDPRVAPRGCKHPGPGCCSKYPGTPGRQFPPGTLRLTPVQAATLQSYPTGFIWTGPTSRQYLQIGNAVPPLLADVVFRALWAPRIAGSEADGLP